MRPVQEREYQAFTLNADADVAADEAGTVPVDWKTVLDEARN